MSTDIKNPIQAQADASAEAALKDKVNGIISIRMKDLLPNLAADFGAALNEGREPTPAEIALAIEGRGGNQPTAFSNDNDGKTWYVNEKLVPLIAIMNAGGSKKTEQIHALREYLFNQEFIKHLSTKEADDYLATTTGDTW